MTNDTKDDAASTTIYNVNYVKRPRELYSYTFASHQRRDILRVIGRQAIDPQLSLDWRDVLDIETRIRELCKRGERCR